MRKTTIRIGTGLLFCFWLASCATLPKRQPTGLRPEAFWKDQARRMEATRRLSGKVGLRLEGKEHNISGRGRLVAQSPGALRLELRDPLGRVQYVLATSGLSLTAYYPRQKLAYVESSASGRLYVKRFMGLDFSFPELEDIFLGVLPPGLRKPSFDSWEWDAEHGAYRGVMQLTGNRKVTAMVDPDNAALQGLTLETPTDRVQAQYRDFSSCCGQGGGAIPLARVVKVELVKPPSVVELEWNDIERLEKPREASVFHLELPSDVRRVGLD